MSATETQLEDHLEHNDDRLDRMDSSHVTNHDENLKFQERTNDAIQKLHDDLQTEHGNNKENANYVLGFMAAISLGIAAGWVKKLPFMQAFTERVSPSRQHNRNREDDEYQSERRNRDRQDREDRDRE